MNRLSKLAERAHLLAAAGLWHDLGKVGEPAAAPLDPHVANLDQTLCPTDSFGRYTHRHVLYTAQLLEVARSAGSDFGGLDPRALFRVATSHHVTHPGSLDEAILKKADWLASGHDRREADREDPQALAVAGLWPILASLRLPGEKPTAGQNAAGDLRRIVPPELLSWDEKTILPVPAIPRHEYAQACGRLWDVLKQHLSIRAADLGEYVERLQALLLRTVHAIPASRQVGQQADVSLYDHSHLTAAFAACLACLFDPAQTQECDPNRLRGRYRILQLAVGSIQPFILRSVSALDAPAGETVEKGMARRLRARSFFVSLLTWLAARRVLEAAGLPIVNLIFDGGGRAILLLPDMEAILGPIQRALAEIEAWFTDTLGSFLRWDVAWSRSLTDTDFTAEHFGDAYREVTHTLAEARYGGSLTSLRSADGWNEEAWLLKGPTLPVDRADFQERFEQVGRFLPRARFLRIVRQGSPVQGPALEIFDYTVELWDRPPRNGLTYALDLEYAERLDQPVWLVGSHVPVADERDIARLAAERNSSEADDSEPLEVGDIIPFEELSRLSEDEQHRPLSYPMLAVLKADVDHLGMLLSMGLGEAVSFGRLATLARTLNQFFKGFLNHQIAIRYPHIYTVFAGGDDLFLIGPWFDVVRLTRDLHGWFVRLTCGNPFVTFSAGIVFAQPRIPVRHLAHEGEAALEKAKDLGRNRITITSRTFSWDLFKEGVRFSQLLQRCAGNGSGERRPGVSRAMLYRLLQYANMALRETKTLVDLKWRAQLSYDAKRNLPEPDHSPEIKELHESLAQIQSPDDAAVLFVGTLLTLYALRGGKP